MSTEDGKHKTTSLVQLTARTGDVLLAHKFVDRFVQGLEIGTVTITHTMLQVVFQDDLGGAAQRRANSGKLDQHLGAVASVLHHSFDGLKMSDGPGQTIDNRLGLRVGMAVIVPVAVRSLMIVGDEVAVNYTISVIVCIEFFLLHGIHPRFL